MTVATITYADVPGFPEGTVVGSISVSFVGQLAADSQTQSVAPGTPSVTFTLAPDTYNWTVQAADANGKGLGTPITGTFVVVAPTVTLSIPSAVSVA